MRIEIILYSKRLLSNAEASSFGLTASVKVNGRHKYWLFEYPGDKKAIFPALKECEEETVSHFFTCVARARRRRAHFTNRIAWRRRILQEPLEILGYLLGEEEPHIKKGLFGLGRN